MLLSKFNVKNGNFEPYFIPNKRRILTGYITDDEEEIIYPPDYIKDVFECAECGCHLNIDDEYSYDLASSIYDNLNYNVCICKKCSLKEVKRITAYFWKKDIENDK